MSGLSGLQKAGVLMVSLGAETSAKVFDCLTPEERDLLGGEIVKLRHVDDVVRRSVLEEVNEIVINYRSASEFPVTPAPSPVNVPMASESDEPFKWLEALDSVEVAKMLGRERPQNIALVLAHITPQAAAGILSNLSESARNQVAHRLVAMKPVSQEAIEAVDEAMRKKAGRAQAKRNREGMLGILGGATELVKDSVNKALGIPEGLPIAAPAVPRSFDTFEDILRLSDAEMKAALFELDFADVCLAVRVAGDELRSAVLKNMSEEAGLTLRREISSTAQIRVREIERAQHRIVETLNRLFAGNSTMEAVVG